MVTVTFFPSGKTWSVPDFEGLEMNAPLKKLNELTGVVFDGRRSGYVPPKKLSISPEAQAARKAKAASTR